MSDVPEGYKMSEVGVIPKEWEVKTFGEIFKFLSTGSNSRSDLSEYGEIKNIHYGDIHTKWKHFLDCSNDIIPSIDKDMVNNLPLLEDGDLIMADASEDYEGLGISVEVKNIKNEKVVAGLHTLLLRGDKTIVADGFKGYIQSIKIVQDSLKRINRNICLQYFKKQFKVCSNPSPTPPRTTSHRLRLKRCGCTHNRTGAAHHQKAQHQTGRHAAAHYWQETPAGVWW
jgi:type I restriction enzyme S subunit